MALRYLLFFFFLMLFLTGHCENEKQHNCPRSFDCGSRGRFQYPFTKAELPYCGLLLIHGCEDTYYFRKMIQLDKNATTLELTGSLDSNTIITIYDADFHASLEQNKCHALNTTYTLPPPSPLLSIYIEYNVSLFRCNHNLRIKLPLDYGNFTCGDYDIYYDKINTSPTIHDAGGIFSHCSLLHFATKDAINSTDVLSFLSSEIALKVVLSPDCDDCFNHRRGQCQLDTNNKFYCDEVPKDNNKALKVGVGIGLGMSTLLGLLIIGCFLRRRYRRKDVPSDLQYQSNYASTNPEAESKRGYFGVPLFSYKELKEATNNFHHTTQLGKGGFGTVYYGKLRDGRDIAVKRLYEHNYRRMEQFMNEIDILARLRHKNLVSLYGYCTSPHSRELLLVYEFVQNGTIQNGALSELVDPTLDFDSDNEVKRMIVSVAELAFQCLQRDRELRPTMDEVLKLLITIECGKAKDEHIDEVDLHPSSSTSPASPDLDEVGLLKNRILLPSPKAVTDRWNSESTSSNVSG
ncbi:hypothetical protein Ahy_A09g042081 [Arachis hypogaea]|uniref:Protein kinase domain-containing protein n=1 Tax=Arachis hypogaea TaxID=3818 RepID=A0A445BEP7_ARAHY|nr:hypothetical protein Ahy_A09g042081 [Arachis hypogaea]